MFTLLEKILCDIQKSAFSHSWLVPLRCGCVLSPCVPSEMCPQTDGKKKLFIDLWSDRLIGFGDQMNQIHIHFERPHPDTNFYENDIAMNVANPLKAIS